jgi:hypothetical protein
MKSKELYQEMISKSFYETAKKEKGSVNLITMENNNRNKSLLSGFPGVVM